MQKRGKGTGGPAPADSATGSKAAAAVASKAAATAAVTTAADKRETAAANTAAVAPTAAVARSYIEAVKATLPSAAALRAAAEAAAAACLTRAASKKEVAVAAGSAEAVASPSPPAPPAKCKRRRQQQSEPTGGVEEMVRSGYVSSCNSMGMATSPCVRNWWCSRLHHRHRLQCHPHLHPASPPRRSAAIVISMICLTMISKNAAIV